MLQLMTNLKATFFFCKILPCFLHAAMNMQIPVCCFMQAMQPHNGYYKTLRTVDTNVVTLSNYIVQNLNLECTLQVVLAASKQFQLLASHSVEVGLGTWRFSQCSLPWLAGCNTVSSFGGHSKKIESRPMGYLSTIYNIARGFRNGL